MTARTDLDNAFQYLTDGIHAHVAALKAARDKAGDDSHLIEITAKLRELGDLVVTSTAAV
jgi:hypothetical protein